MNVAPSWGRGSDAAWPVEKRGVPGRSAGIEPLGNAGLWGQYTGIGAAATRAPKPM
jgi:hypothetical protein